MQKNDAALSSGVPASERAARIVHDVAFRQPVGPNRGGPLPAPRLANPVSRADRPVPTRSGVRRVGTSTASTEEGALIHRTDEIIALDKQPVLRNLLITQAYADLSSGLARLLGEEDANWCTFATWASKTAGRFIRKDEVPSMLRGLFTSEHRAPSCSGIDLDVLDFCLGDGPGLFNLPGVVLDHVSAMIAQGNLAVYAELGPIFSRMLDFYAGVERPDSELLEALLDPVRPGFSIGGQGLLRNALTHYHNAILTDDPDKKAELILFGNGCIGLHEQMRLDTYIAGALNAPSVCVLNTLSAPASHLPEMLQSSLLDRLIWPVVERIQALWRALATREMMTLMLPNEVLYLGRDLPSQEGEPLFPIYLDTIEDPELYELLRKYDAHDSTADGCGAEDWAKLPSRMSYILELFRSRQRCPSLRGRPFTVEQHREILAGRVPTTGHL